MREHDKKPFIDGIATLHFHERGTSTLHEWLIGCDAANDTADTIKAHLARWRPECELDWVEIQEVASSGRREEPR